MSDKCKATVYPQQAWGSFHGHPCKKPVWKDGFCKVHHPETVAERNKKFRLRYEATRSYVKALEKIAALEAELEELQAKYNVKACEVARLEGENKGLREGAEMLKAELESETKWAAQYAQEAQEAREQIPEWLCEGCLTSYPKSFVRKLSDMFCPNCHESLKPSTPNYSQRARSERARCLEIINSIDKHWRSTDSAYYERSVTEYHDEIIKRIEGEE
jgi:hypothetical protein